MTASVICFSIWRTNPHEVACFAISIFLFLAQIATAEDSQPFRADSSWTIIGHVRVGLDGYADNVRLVQMPDGREFFLVRSVAPAGEELLSGDELLELLKSQSVRRTWAHRFFQTSGTAGFVWVGIGIAAQILFAGRMIVQWIVSERSKRSVVPVAFWWISLLGASMLLLYFTWRRDVVGILGQSMGWLIYVRNLVLIYRQNKSRTST